MLDPSRVRELPKKEAVETLRRQVFQRAEGLCQRCGHPVTWQTMHMDERKARGEGGEQSMENCWALCYDCHIGREDAEHGNRRLRFNEEKDFQET